MESLRPLTHYSIPFILNQTTRVHIQEAHKPHIHKQNIKKIYSTENKKLQNREKWHEVHHVHYKLTAKHDKLEAVVIASALDDMYRLKAVLQLLTVVYPGDTDICRKSIWRPPSCCII